MGVLVEARLRGFLSVPSNSRMPHTKFLHGGATCLAQSAAAGTASCRFLSSVVNVFVLETGTVVHEAARQDSRVSVLLLV